MHVTEWQAAAANLLEYSRDPRRSLHLGRKLGPALLQTSCPATAHDWTLADDWTLTAALKDLIRSMIGHFRALTGSKASVRDSVIEHRSMLRHDITQGRSDLKFWSLLWAYYICGMSHDEIAATCDWSIRTSQLRLKEARDTYLVQKLVELEYCQRQNSPSQCSECRTNPHFVPRPYCHVQNHRC